MKKNAFPFCTWKDLIQKEVINKYDGSRLGYIKNAGLDLFSGNLTSLILPCPGAGLFPKKEDLIVIPWNDIDKIGEDVILVRYSREKECVCKEK